MLAADRVSLTLAQSPPRILSIVGESGSGKTTVARALLGLSPPTSGSVLYRGANVYGLRGAAMAMYRKEVQAIFQDPYGIYNPFYRIDRVFNMLSTNSSLRLARRNARSLSRALYAP